MSKHAIDILISKGEKYKKYLTAKTEFGELSDVTFHVETLETGDVQSHSFQSRLETLQDAYESNNEAAGQSRAYLSGKTPGFFDRCSWFKTRFNHATDHMNATQRIANSAKAEIELIVKARDTLEQDAQDIIGAEITSLMTNE